jgi:hypothetical protein
VFLQEEVLPVLNMLHNCKFHCLLSAVEETTVIGNGSLSDHCWYLTEVRNLKVKADTVLAEIADY